LIVVISLGAGLGSLLRRVLGLKLNALFPTVPSGMFAANLIGGYIIGIAIAYFAQAHHLFNVPGGSGTASVTGRLGWATGAIGIHVTGSVIMTLAGIGSWHWLASAHGTGSNSIEETTTMNGYEIMRRKATKPK
jgi:CrcB protein